MDHRSRIEEGCEDGAVARTEGLRGRPASRGARDAVESGAQPAPAGSEFQVNTYTSGSQQVPSVTAQAPGDFVVVWSSQGSSGGDTSGSSIQGQRYTAPHKVPSLSPAGLAGAALLTWLAVGIALRRRR